MEKKRLFYDIETSFCEGHFWRPGYNQRIGADQILKHSQIICISWAWNDGEVQHLDWDLDKQCDKKLLKKFIKELDKADEIIAHNGDKFDIKTIRTRAMFHNIQMRPKYRMIDTYKLCKSYLNLPSASLKEACKYFDIEQKADSGGMQTWIGVVLDKDPEAMEQMLYYCDHDITALRSLYNKLQNWIAPSFHYGVKGGGEKFMCPECGSANVGHSKDYVTRAGTIQRQMKCRECKKNYTISNKVFQKLLEFKWKHGIK